MSLTVSIARRDIYTTAGEYDTTLYEIQTNTDDEFIQDLQLESVDDLLTLRTAIDHFINTNNLNPQHHEH